MVLVGDGTLAGLTLRYPPWSGHAIEDASWPAQRQVWYFGWGFRLVQRLQGGSYETARFHQLAWWRGGIVAVRGSAEPVGKIWRVGQVFPGTPGAWARNAQAFEQRLVGRGYRLGETLTLVTRFVAPEPKVVEDAIQLLIKEIDLLVTYTTIVGVAAKRSPTIFQSFSWRLVPRSRLGSSRALLAQGAI